MLFVGMSGSLADKDDGGIGISLRKHQFLSQLRKATFLREGEELAAQISEFFCFGAAFGKDRHRG